MELHEFQAKSLLTRYAIPSPPGAVATTAREAALAARELGPAPVVVKAQIRAGDRAAAGGIRMAAPADAESAAAELLGRRLVTRQTGPAGQVVRRVLVEAHVGSARELCLAMTVDADGALTLIGGPGGSGIEQRAASGAAGLETLALSSRGEIRQGDIAGFCTRLGLDGRQAGRCQDIIRGMHRAFVELDASLIEINPLAVTTSDVVALDAKIVLDDNALFRHSDLAGLQDEDIDPVERKAQRHQINFLGMDGDIGVVVNGAGLALATLDMIGAAGGRPANFMDIRTTARSLDIAEGIGLVLDNPRARVLLVNVYGGGMQPCDTIIEGLGIAARRKGKCLPVVMRLTGNNEDVARLRLANFKLPAVECADMGQAVTRAVAIAQGRA